jgi:hypothetical protein
MNVFVGLIHDIPHCLLKRLLGSLKHDQDEQKRHDIGTDLINMLRVKYALSRVHYDATPWQTCSQLLSTQYLAKPLTVIPTPPNFD